MISKIKNEPTRNQTNNTNTRGKDSNLGENICNTATQRNKQNTTSMHKDSNKSMCWTNAKVGVLTLIA